MPMTGNQCHRRKKMMGRGPDGGCGTQETTLCPVSRAPATSPAESPVESPAVSPADLPESRGKELVPIGVNCYEQARKALAQRCPFDPEDGSGSGWSSIRTLPSGLASFVSRYSDSRKKHKKSHSGGEAKLKPKSAGSNIWTETDDCFRELALNDIDILYESSSIRDFGLKQCFTIPFPGMRIQENVSAGEVLDVNSNAENVSLKENSNVNGVGVSSKENSNNANGVGVSSKENPKENGVGVSSNSNENSNANGVGLDSEVVAKGEEINGDGKIVENQKLGSDILPKAELGTSEVSKPVSNDLGWLLSVKTRHLLTSERPSKKRKLLGADAGLDRLIVVQPVEGTSSLCHFCCIGDTGEAKNPLIVCNSCNVAVHKLCYGVKEDDTGSWLCSWCKHKIDSKGNKQENSDVGLKPCELCPRESGGLWPVHGSEKFGHLFCALWMPEVYVQDTGKMELIMNAESIKEARKKSVCNICKVKLGACIRCTNGTCRTAFHPICAREARHKMEIWGKYGCDNVELRAFCSKHSEIKGISSGQQVDTLSVVADNANNNLPVTVSLNKSHKIKIGRRNGDKNSLPVETTDSNSKPESGESKQLTNLVAPEGKNSEDVNPSVALDSIGVLKKLIELGKVNLKDVASDIGISPASLSTKLADDVLVPELRSEIVKWLRDHAHLGNTQKNLKVKIKSATSSKAENGDTADVPPVKSDPPLGKTKERSRSLKDTKGVHPALEKFISQNENGKVDRGEVDPLPSKGPEHSCEEGAIEKILMDPPRLEESSSGSSPKSDGNRVTKSNCSLSDRGQVEEATAASNQNVQVNLAQENLVSSDVVIRIASDLMKKEEASSSYVHPSIQSKLIQMQCGSLLEKPMDEFDGSRKREISSMEASSSTSGVPCDGITAEDLVTARNMGLLQMAPEDEVEGELLYFQHKLLANAVARMHLTEDLIHKVLNSLPHEIASGRQQRWDSVVVNQYLCDIREAKKQGRKEKRHKEAQAVLAAATAAAASSSRVSSLRKDALDESLHLESPLKVNTSSGRVPTYSQLMPRAKETISRLGSGRISSEKHSNNSIPSSEFSKEHSRSCEICRRSETILNPVLTCSSCKVSVHLDCYRSVKETTGPWYCELCDDLLSSRNIPPPAVGSQDNSFPVMECGVCGGSGGAFRKSTDGKWVHAFCAEWAFESTFRRGQVNPVEGMESTSKGNDICSICSHKHGICIKCNFGHCPSMFHPSCARTAGFYMHVKSGGGRLQHKAYCEKHSLEQRSKVDTQKHGIEELKSIKQIRVELERLRLLCERIIKREKLKRELVICSHEILASRRDSAASSFPSRSLFCPPDVSSESATTSLKGHVDGYRSCSEAIQRSDDITVDSTVSGKRRIKLPVSMDIDQKTDDSSTSQHHVIQNPMERASFSGKHIPHRPSSAVSRNLSDDGDKRSKPRKHVETFVKELVMTSDEATMKNQLLPKGYFYVPAESLSKEKQINKDESSRETSEPDG